MSITTQPTPITTATCAATPCAKVSGSGDFFALHRLQIPFGKRLQHFTTLAKPLRQVATPFCNNCKALSASGHTILQQLQSPVSTWPYPFTTDAKPFRQLAKPLCNCCNAFQSIISHSQYSKLRPHFSKQQFS